jgi:hypothetical protein
MKSSSVLGLVELDLETSLLHVRPSGLGFAILSAAPIDDRLIIYRLSIRTLVIKPG